MGAGAFLLAAFLLAIAKGGKKHCNAIRTIPFQVYAARAGWGLQFGWAYNGCNAMNVRPWQENAAYATRETRPAKVYAGILKRRG